MQTRNEIIDGLNINWSLFGDDEARMIQKCIESGRHDYIAAALLMLTPEKEAEIAKVQAQLRPRSFVFQSRTQKEFEAWLNKNPTGLTPEIEAEWQAKIDKEREEALRRMTGNLPAEAKATDTGAKVMGSNRLDDVPGLGQKSIAKLQASGIFSIEELQKRPHADLVKILNPLVAAGIRKFFNKP